jgi:general secretion pathway protein F
MKTTAVGPRAFVIDAQGRVHAAPRVPAQDRAVRAMRAPGVSVRATAAGTGRAIRFDRGQFAEDLAELLGAGLSVHESLGVLAQRPGRRRERDALAALRARVEQGASLSSAMGAQPEVFGEALAALVGASETTSSLQPGLRRFAAATRRMEALRAHVVSSAIYPVLLVVVASAVLLFLMAVVVPRFADVIGQGGATLSEGAQRLLGAGEWLGAMRSVWVPAVVALPLALAAIGASEPGRELLRRGLARIPGVGEALRDMHRARFFATVATLALGGVPALRALELGASLLLPADRDGLRVGADAVRRGEPVASALAGQPFEDPVVLRLLEIGQRTGGLPESLERIGALLDARVGRRIDRLMRVFEPALMLAIGALIGLVVILMYVPILELATSVR